MRERALDLGYAAGWGVLNSVPEPIARRWVRAAADAAARRNGPGVRQLRRNLRRVAGPTIPAVELDRLVNEALRSYARYWHETFRLPKMDHAAVLAAVRTEGVEHLDAGIAAGRGVVVALPHMGNWDIAALWLVHHRRRFTTVVERLRPESLFNRFVAYRQSLGMEVIALTGGQRPPLEVLTERLRAGGVVCLVADRNLSRGGVEVDFFGEPAHLPGGPALLAAITGAALLPVGLWFAGTGWRQRINAPIRLPDGRLRHRVAAGTQALANGFTREIAAHPADWHMLQRLWLADLPARPSPAME